MIYKVILSKYKPGNPPTVLFRKLTIFQSEAELKKFMKEYGHMSWWAWRKFLWELDKKGTAGYIFKDFASPYTIVVGRRDE